MITNGTIEASAPGKLILFGEHVGRHGKPVLVYAINRRLHAYLTPNEGKGIFMTSDNLGVNMERYPSEKLDFATAAIKSFFEKTGESGSFNIEFKSELIGGFGSSGALITATLGVLNKHFGSKLTNEDILDMGISIEREVSGVGSGIDIAAALWGGMILYKKGADVKRVNYKDFPIIVGNTGLKVKSKVVVDDMTALELKYAERFDTIINEIGKISEDAARAFEAGDYVRVGELMNINHGLLYSCNASSIELERLVWAARNAGALGAKLSGAGRGDNMLAVAPQNAEEVKDAIRAAGGMVSDVSIEKNGLA